MTRDLLFGVRMVLKRPGFSLIVVLTLAIGIGATAAVFSLIQGVLLTPPPYRDPAQIVLPHPHRRRPRAASSGLGGGTVAGVADGGRDVRRDGRLPLDLQLLGIG